MAGNQGMPWRRMWDFIAWVGQEHTLNGLLTRAVRELPRLVPGEHSFAINVDFSQLCSQTSIGMTEDGFPSGARETYLRRYAHIDPGYLEWRPGVPFVQVDWRERRFVGAEIACDFMKAVMHVDMTAGIVMEASCGTGAVYLGLTRVGTGRLSDHDKAILFALRDPLQNYYSCLKRLEDLNGRGYFAAELAKENRLLSRREAEIASLLCRRMSAPEIATLLLISLRTVERHIDHIYEKLHVRDRRELLHVLLSPSPE